MSVKLLERILRAGEGRTLKRLRNIAHTVNAIEDEYKGCTDGELRTFAFDLKVRHQNGESLDSILPEAFAMVREASSRTLGLRHFDVQIMGGAALHMGYIAEMFTGEGKTLVATLPAFLNSLSGNGVHIVTVNDYLAGYHSQQMGRVYKVLGLETGVILADQDPSTRAQQYRADITYGTNNEFGFDYLRDNMAWSCAERVQRGHNFVILDEVDSILIDEARTPLIISGSSSGEVSRWFVEFAGIARALTAGEDYDVDERKHTVGVLEPGIAKVEDLLGISNLYESVNTPLISFLNNSIKAKELFKRDRDYVVLDGEVMIVDEHTGRILSGRRYNEGLHQAIEAKEGVEIKAENQTLATVTLQNYFRLYKKISGMTGTAVTEASEFMSTYKLPVVSIPTNKPNIRKDHPDVVYKNEQIKFENLADHVRECYTRGQPVLIGTTSVEKSEYVSKLLSKRGVRHEVLNAKNHAKEARIVAEAGRLRAVTVATNMAGRGTDIILGGNPEVLTAVELRRKGLDPSKDPERYEQAWSSAFPKLHRRTREEAEKVIEAGGLMVIGTERHESRRIDNQLRGRSGRQGDPGESRFYLSLTDDLMRKFNPGAESALAARVPDDTAIESKLVSRAIRSAQAQVESLNAETRKNVLKYDDVLNRQRAAIYTDRSRILEGGDIADRVQAFLSDAIEEIINSHAVTAWDFDALWADLKTIYPVGISIEELTDEAGGMGRITPDFVMREILSDAKFAYEKRESEIGPESMRDLERKVVLSVIDRCWRDHLYEMEYLKEGIGLRAMAQRDPLVEYQKEGFDMFEAMMGRIREESIGYLFNIDAQVSSNSPSDARNRPIEHDDNAV
ncbi:preprotein translocase subunit SecA [Tropheryma whipplei]|uniref:preprotein translocase subunit SecA n=1 Tax=Tropheryma whipplei TaxID=2039 RepID=UPI0004B77644|nr:preprotein translocase subunit SecA [Tropheryma whipplei]